MKRRVVMFGDFCIGKFAALLLCGALCAHGEGTATVEGDRLILDAFVTNITTEADLGAASEIVFRNGAGVSFVADGSQAVNCTKPYVFDGDGLAATGVVEVAAGRTITVTGRPNLIIGSVGHTLVKKGGGAMYLSVGPGPVASPTRWIIEEGLVIQDDSSFFGNHKTTTPNCVIDVREGAVYRTKGSHCPIGAIELTGATINFTGGDPVGVSDWAASALRGGVRVHACETKSVIDITTALHLNHEYNDVPFVIEPGAVLDVYGVLRNGWNTAYDAQMNNKLVASGGGVLRLIGDNCFTGGVKIEDGTTVIASCATSLGLGGTLEIAGNATLEVLAGATISLDSITGNGTLTKTGAGVLTCANVAPGVTIARAEGEGNQGMPVVNGVAILNGGMTIINVPTGETLQLTGFASSDPELQKKSDVSKTGGGTLVLPNADNASQFRNIIVSQGDVRIAAEENIGNGIVLQNGGVLSFSASATMQNRAVSVEGNGVINVPQGLTATFNSTNLVSFKNARITKTGSGKLLFRADKFFVLTDKTANAHLVAHEGTMSFNSDPFGTHTTHPSQVIEVHSGAKVSARGHVPFGRVVMLGGMFGTDLSASLVGTENTVTPGTNDNPLAEWGQSISFNGTVEAHPGPDGEECVIKADRIYLAHNSSSRMNVTTFDVAEGATLRICGGRIDDGRNSAGKASVATGFVKNGKGELVLDSDAGFTGVAQIEEGVFTIGECGRINASARLNVTPGATVRLADGAVLATGVETDEAFVKTADVWFDATHLAARPGDLVTHVPNLGTAGGEFAKFKTGNIPAAPVYTPGAINGKPALHFNGGAALVTDAYTNKTATMSVFMVAQWTSWNYNDGKGGLGHWGGGISMSTDKATTTDNGTYYSFHTETPTDIKNTYIQASNMTDSNPTMSNPNRAVGTSYLDEIVCNGAQMLVRQYVGPGIGEATTSANQIAGRKFDINRMCVGGRMSRYGGCTYGKSVTDSANRMYIGYIGEVIVFTRVLTEDEKNVVRAYLKRKWFADETVQVVSGLAANSAAGVTIDVPEGSAALAGTWTSAGVQVGAPVFTKTGAGTLNLRAAVSGDGVVKAEEGTLEASGRKVASRADVWLDAADASTVTVEGGKATSVANKGRSGGAFGTCPGRYDGQIVPFPAYEEGGINERNVLRFNWNSGLMLDSYTNVYTGRRLHMYMVLQRTAYEEESGEGKWSGPFSFISTSATENDQMVATASHIEETMTNTVSVYVGTISKQIVLPAGKLGEPYIFTQHQLGNNALTTYEWEDTDENNVSLIRHPSTITATNEVNRILLGGRGTAGGRMQCVGGDVRTWAGRMGEVLVFTELLSKQEEEALKAYLRAKWLAKGTASPEPPAFLSGEYAPPSFDGAGLELGDGTVMEQAGPTCTLASLTAGDDVTFVRDWEGDESGFALFDVTGAMTFGMNPSINVVASPGKTAKMFGGEADSELPEWTVYGDGANTSRVIRRADGVYLSIGGGTVLYLR